MPRLRSRSRRGWASWCSCVGVAGCTRFRSSRRSRWRVGRGCPSGVRRAARVAEFRRSSRRRCCRSSRRWIPLIRARWTLLPGWSPWCQDQESTSPATTEYLHPIASIVLKFPTFTNSGFGLRKQLLATASGEVPLSESGYWRNTDLGATARGTPLYSPWLMLAGLYVSKPGQFL